MAVAFGRYQLLKKIASGGMGQVFLARTAQQGFDKLVVIKRILPHLVEDEEFLTMFFDEARIAARLNHPNLAQIFDLGEVNGMHYLAMEYVAGDDVRRLEKQARKQNRPIPLGAACRIIADAAAGLDYAHKLKDARGAPMNLIHRDVSPQNILVSFDGGVKLIDFGVARAAGRAQHTATGILKGKYPYMSPEQIAGLPYDHRSDQFALAIIFWEILTGRRLFKGDSDFVTMRLVRECNVPVPSELNPRLPKALDAIILRALSADPADRYPDVGALRMAIEELTVTHGIAATPAHLAQYMRDLYAERIEREADVSALDELSGNAAFEEDSNPSDSRASVGPGAVMGAQAPDPAEAPASTRERALDATVSSRPNRAGQRVTQAMTRPGAAPKRGLGVPVITGAAVAVIALAVGLPLLLRESASPQEGTPEATAPAAAAGSGAPQARVPAPGVEPDRPPEPAPVRIELVSEPEGAEVAVDGEPLGRTPVAYHLVPGTPARQVTFTLPGYEPLTTTVNADSAPALRVALRRKQRPTPARTPEPAPPPIKTGR